MGCAKILSAGAMNVFVYTHGVVARKTRERALRQTAMGEMPEIEPFQPRTQISDEQWERIPLKFILFLPFSILGLFAVINGYDFFHANNPSGSQAFSFLIPAAASLFLGFHLIKAYTDPLPAWYTYFSMPHPQLNADQVNKAKRVVTRIYGFIYVVAMSGFIIFFVGPRLGYSPERMVLPLLFGVLGVFVLMSLLQIFAAFYRYWKDPKPLNPADPQSPKS